MFRTEWKLSLGSAAESPRGTSVSLPNERYFPMTTGIDYILSGSTIGGTAYKVFYVPSTTHQAHTLSFQDRKMSTYFLP